MALAKRIEKIRRDRHSVHKQTRCTCVIFTDSNGAKYLQLDTYGSEDREIEGKVSQTLQFNSDSAAELRALIEEAFPS